MAYIQKLTDKPRTLPWRAQVRRKGHKVLVTLNFACTLGATRNLMPDRTTTNNHPERDALWADYYRYAKRWGNATNIDWTIPGLEKLLARPDPLVSLCVWRSLQSLERPFFFAKFRHAESYSIREKPASFVYQLRSIAWIPSVSGKFHKPKDITEAELLPEVRHDGQDRLARRNRLGYERKAASSRISRATAGCDPRGNSR